MEEDRALTDLGIAADIEEAHAPPPPDPSVKQPRKRFVGRRAASRNTAAERTVGDGGAIQGMKMDIYLFSLPPPPLFFFQKGEK